MAERPQNEEELQKREAIGVIRASRFVRQYASSHKPIDMDTISLIHKEIFKEAWTEIAGKYRDENLEITDSKHLPPHHSQVFEQMDLAGKNLSLQLEKLQKTEGLLIVSDVATDEVLQAIDDVVACVAWIHHTLTYIHPFRDGNGRTARLAANLILERYGLVGISIKMEKENKNRYRQALAQIDSVKDYEPLKAIIFEGLMDRYDGVSMKYYNV